MSNLSGKVKIIFSWNAKHDLPLANIIFDALPAFDLAVFDYSGAKADQSLTHTSLSKGRLTLPCQLISHATQCKGEMFYVCAMSLADDLAHYSYVAFVDDDILVRVSCLNSAIRYGMAFELTAFQPSLARCSYYSHLFTLQQQGNAVRMVDWVEVMMPFVRANLFLEASSFYQHSISSYGIDCYVWPVLAIAMNIGNGFAVIDNAICAHIRPISSGARVFSSGLTGLQEMEIIRQKLVEYLDLQCPEINEHPRVKALLSFSIK